MGNRFNIAGLVCCSVLFSTCAIPSYVIVDPETEIASMEEVLAGNQATITSIDNERFEMVSSVEIDIDRVSWYDSLLQERAGMAYERLDKIEVFEASTYKAPRLGRTLLYLFGESLLGAAILGIWAENNDPGWGLPVVIMAPIATVPASIFLTAIYRSVKRRKTLHRVGVYKFFHYATPSSRSE